jgi:polyisoprenyl-phosphate glycosyltransferase
LKTISIISPCYNEQDNIEVCYLAVREVFERELSDYSYQHIFADNASTDSSMEILREIARKDPKVTVLKNARNYGPFRSVFNALGSATGDATLVMLPVDLQDPPELIPKFVDAWEEGAMIVFGQRTQRQESMILRTIRQSYYKLVNSISNFSIPVNAAEFQLIDRAVLKTLLKSDDHYPYIRGMIANCGFEDSKVAIPYTWKSRKNGKSKNSIFNLVDQAINGLISFSNLPLRIATLGGFVLATLSILYAFIQLVINLFLEEGFTQPGIPTLIVAIFFFSGIQLFFVGILGEYIGAIHSQVRRGADVKVAERLN